MRKKDFQFHMFAWPILGAFVAFLIGSIFEVRNDSLGIMLLLGIMSGPIALYTYIYGLKSCSCEEGEDTNKNNQ
ncbi:MAG: hypothetical protein N2645_07885 [Clostridia bacterium]|nr:hypothetical protein [Clostridia bacterium]